MKASRKYRLAATVCSVIGYACLVGILDVVRRFPNDVPPRLFPACIFLFVGNYLGFVMTGSFTTEAEQERDKENRRG